MELFSLGMPQIISWGISGVMPWSIPRMIYWENLRWIPEGSLRGVFGEIYRNAEGSCKVVSGRIHTKSSNRFTT